MTSLQELKDQIDKLKKRNAVLEEAIGDIKESLKYPEGALKYIDSVLKTVE